MKTSVWIKNLYWFLNVKRWASDKLSSLPFPRNLGKTLRWIYSFSVKKINSIPLPSPLREPGKKQLVKARNIHKDRDAQIDLRPEKVNMQIAKKSFSDNYWQSRVVQKPALFQLPTDECFPVCFPPLRPPILRLCSGSVANLTGRKIRRVSPKVLENLIAAKFWPRFSRKE
jgi:hypothetical protein